MDIHSVEPLFAGVWRGTPGIRYMLATSYNKPIAKSSCIAGVARPRGLVAPYPFYFTLNMRSMPHSKDHYSCLGITSGYVNYCLLSGLLTCSVNFDRVSLCLFPLLGIIMLLPVRYIQGLTLTPVSWQWDRGWTIWVSIWNTTQTPILKTIIRYPANAQIESNNDV